MWASATLAPTSKLELEGTASVSNRKIGINDVQVLYLPDQSSSAFTGSLFIGNGGGNLIHTAGVDGFFNTGIGIAALSANTTGHLNTAVGHSSLAANTSGQVNTAGGYSALVVNTTGSGNTAYGYNALAANNTGSLNTAYGSGAGLNITTGNYNSIVGYNSGVGITTGNYNTILGSQVSGLAAGLSSNIIIADGLGNWRINVDSSGNVGLGTPAPTAVLSVNGAANNTTGVWGVFSDSRLKNIEGDFSDGLDKLLQFHPKKFKYNGKEGITATMTDQVGVIAQDVEQFAPYMVSTIQGQELTDVRQFSSQALPYMIINSVKELVHISGTFKSRLVAWLADNANGITKIFAREICLTDEAGSTCFTRAQMNAAVSASTVIPLSEPPARSTESVIEFMPEVGSIPAMPTSDADVPSQQ